VSTPFIRGNRCINHPQLRTRSVANSGLSKLSSQKQTRVTQLLTRSSVAFGTTTTTTTQSVRGRSVQMVQMSTGDREDMIALKDAYAQMSDAASKRSILRSGRDTLKATIRSSRKPIVSSVNDIPMSTAPGR